MAQFHWSTQDGNQGTTENRNSFARGIVPNSSVRNEGIHKWWKQWLTPFCPWWLWPLKIFHWVVWRYFIPWVEVLPNEFMIFKVPGQLPHHRNFLLLQQNCKLDVMKCPLVLPVHPQRRTSNCVTIVSWGWRPSDRKAFRLVISTWSTTNAKITD